MKTLTKTTQEVLGLYHDYFIWINHGDDESRAILEHFQKWLYGQGIESTVLCHVCDIHTYPLRIYGPFTLVNLWESLQYQKRERGFGETPISMYRSEESNRNGGILTNKTRQYLFRYGNGNFYRFQKKHSGVGYGE